MRAESRADGARTDPGEIDDAVDEVVQDRALLILVVRARPAVDDDDPQSPVRANGDLRCKRHDLRDAAGARILVREREHAHTPAAGVDDGPPSPLDSQHLYIPLNCGAAVCLRHGPGRELGFPADREAPRVLEGV
jgi:hypothetical protein